MPTQFIHLKTNITYYDRVKLNMYVIYTSKDTKYLAQNLNFSVDFSTSPGIGYSENFPQIRATSQPMRTLNH